MPAKKRLPDPPHKINDICANKHKGNPNSVEANKAIEPVKKALRIQVYEVIAANRHGLTCEEIAEQVGRKMHSISGRISELKEARKVVEASTRRVRGISVGVYKATKKGAA